MGAVVSLRSFPTLLILIESISAKRETKYFPGRAKSGHHPVNPSKSSFAFLLSSEAQTSSWGYMVCFLGLEALG
jgi:hypothetical protein